MNRKVGLYSFPVIANSFQKRREQSRRRYGKQTTINIRRVIHWFYEKQKPFQIETIRSRVVTHKASAEEQCLHT